MKPLTIAELVELPAAIDLITAARALRLGRTKAYELARRGEFPCAIFRVGDTYRVPTSALLDLLGVTAPTAFKLTDQAA